jgi:tetratricopeptide (TPR) repeat protein
MCSERTVTPVDLPDSHFRPGFIWRRRLIGEVLLQKGDVKAALAEMQKESDEQSRLTGLSMVYHALGRKAESDAAIFEAIEKYPKTSAHPIAVALAFRGEKDRAFEWLEKAVRYNDPDLGGTAVQPFLANLHSDPLAAVSAQARHGLRAARGDQV